MGTTGQNNPGIGQDDGGGLMWFWVLPGKEDGQDGQHRQTQDGQEKSLTTLTNMDTFPEREAG